MGLYFANRRRALAHAEHAGNAQGFETGEHFHRLRGWNEVGRSGIGQGLLESDNGGLFARRNSSLHVTGSSLGQWLWFQVWCLEPGLHIIRAVCPTKPVQRRVEEDVSLRFVSQDHQCWLQAFEQFALLRGAPIHHRLDAGGEPWGKGLHQRRRELLLLAARGAWS